MRAAGLGEIHFNAQNMRAEMVEACKACGIDSLTDYNMGPGCVPSAPARRAAHDWQYDYAEMPAALAARLEKMKGAALPYIPNVTTGWDSTPRCRFDEPYPWRKSEYPYSVSFTNNTPDIFRTCLAAAKKWAEEDPRQPGAVYINGWNEYTEGTYLVPNNFDSDGFLRAIAAVFGRKPASEYTYVNPSTKQLFTIPAATKPQPPEPEEAAFPNKTDEKDLYTNLQVLLKSSYVFLENAADIGQKIPKGGPDEGDDPCVVPPVYGARHILATKLDQQPWMNKINMDVHYRIAAGLGRKAVLENQEMLMDRAWKQVEAVQALNMELYKRLLSMGANNALQGKTVGQYGKDNKYLASMMFYLSSMKDAYKEKGDPTLASVLEDRDVPRAFATPSFHGMTDRVAKIVADLDTKSVMENILEYQTYRFPDHEVYGTYPIASLKKYSEDAFTSIFEEIMNTMVLNHFIKSNSSAPSWGTNSNAAKYYVNIVELPKWNAHYASSLLDLNYTTNSYPTSGKLPLPSFLA